MLTQFRTSKLYGRVSEKPIVHQFIKYALVGGLNVLIHVAIFNVLSFLGVHPLVANAAGFFFASINSFIWNKLWAFRDERRDAVVRQYLVFVFFTIVGLGLHSATFALWRIPLSGRGAVGNNLALLLALPVSVIWNFTCYRLWTFKPRVVDAPVGAR